MIKRLKNLLFAWSSIFQLQPRKRDSFRYVNRIKNQTVESALRSDWKNVGNYIWSAIERKK